MAKKGWENLAPRTLKRYKAKGITKESYEAGVSLKDARGHARTPERPTQKISREKFPEYYDKRQQLIRELEEKKRRVFGDRPRWDDQLSKKNIRAKALSNQQLKWAIDADVSELEDAIRDDSETFRFVGYH